MENHDSEPADEKGLTAAEAAELGDLLQGLSGLMLSVKVEAQSPHGLAAPLAERIRTALNEPNCRIQVSDDGADAVLGPMDPDAGDSAGLLQRAMSALGGTWGGVFTTTTKRGPVHYVIRTAAEGPDETEAETARIHLWAATAWALTAYVEEHA
ncbi:hypothetical protein ACWCQL_15930 [Streptomyces sp. NPDC002073]